MTDGFAPDTAVARHISSDRKLIWRVERYREADGSEGFAAGFEDSLWHVHPDELRRPGEGLQKLLDLTADLLADRMIILRETWRPAAENVDDHRTSLLFDLDQELAFKANDDQWSLRFWSGRPVDIEALIDGKVDYRPLDYVWASRD